MSGDTIQVSLGRAGAASGGMVRLTVLFVCTLPLVAKTLYVNGNLNTDPPPDGLTWATAFNTVQGGIDAAELGDEVWVAATEYAENLTLKSGVALYGGFRGDETARDHRNWTAQVTILDGRRSSSVVMVQEGATDLTRIDGFTIRNGLAVLGGGVHCTNASPVIANNLLVSNEATKPLGFALGGGGVFCSGGAPTITGNVFMGNLATNGVGGAVSCADASPVITSNRFLANRATSGGAMELFRCAAHVTGNSLIGNTAVLYGAGIESTRSTNFIGRNEIRGNHPGSGAGCTGAGMACWDSSDQIVNNAILANAAGANQGVGGGISLNNPVRPVVVNNSILWNQASVGGGLSCQQGAATLANNLIAFGSSGIRGNDALVLRNNCIYGNGSLDVTGMQNPYGTNGNVSVDPKLVPAPGYPNCHLSAESPCRTAGDPTWVDPAWRDIDNEPRLTEGSVDIGADQFAAAFVEPARPIVRVRLEGDDANDGSAWTKAKRTVQGAIESLLETGGEVWVASGVFQERITLHQVVHLFGGFGGSEDSRAQRDPRLHATVLDGEALGTVVTAEYIGPWGTLDGFVITNGLASQGGGVRCYVASPTISGNRILGNTASGTSGLVGGGAIYCESASPSIRSNTLANNTAPRGGGIYARLHSSPMIENNLIVSNTAAASGGTAPLGGGGVCADSTSLTLANNALADNRATNTSGGARVYGGGLLLYRTYGHQVINNPFLANTAVNTNTAGTSSELGGALFLVGAPILGSTNTLLANNLIVSNSSGLVVGTGSAGLRSTHNCVFGNTAFDYSGIPDPTGTQGNLAVDPLLANTNDDFHLSPESPCISAGDDSVVSRAWVDLDGQVRIAGAHVDMGADEFGSSLPFTLTLLAGSVGTQPALRLDGEPGRTYVFERSPDLAFWSAFSTNLATNGTVIIEVPSPGNREPQFHRGITGP